jgi:hypothetical protein
VHLLGRIVPHGRVAPPRGQLDPGEQAIHHLEGVPLLDHLEELGEQDTLHGVAPEPWSRRKVATNIIISVDSKGTRPVM